MTQNILFPFLNTEWSITHCAYFHLLYPGWSISGMLASCTEHPVNMNASQNFVYMYLFTYLFSVRGCAGMGVPQHMMEVRSHFAEVGSPFPPCGFQGLAPSAINHWAISLARSKYLHSTSSAYICKTLFFPCSYYFINSSNWHDSYIGRNWLVGNLRTPDLKKKKNSYLSQG